MQVLSSHVWGIVLAGGDGKRLQDFVRHEYGSSCPKQYCVFTGTRSMLTHTIHRAEQLISADRIVTIVNRHHLPYASAQLRDQPQQNILIQPSNRDTAAGILFPLLNIHQRDPEAIVVIFPSDHFVPQETRFLEFVRTAVSYVATQPHSTVLLGVMPSGPEGEYGWIETGEKVESECGDGFYYVSRFVEKPDSGSAYALYQGGNLWNTMVVVSNARVLVRHFEAMTPIVYSSMSRVLSGFNSVSATERIYETLPSINFSQAILSKNPPGLVALNMGKMHWSDWGNSKRILSDLLWLRSRSPVERTFSRMPSRSGADQAV